MRKYVSSSISERTIVGKLTVTEMNSEVYERQRDENKCIST